MKLSVKTTILSLTAVLATTTVLYAARVQLKNSVTPTFTDEGLTAELCGALTGLGNGDVTITVVAEGEVTTQCTNPAGNIAPGHALKVVSMGQTSIPSTEVKNGNVSFCVSTDLPTNPDAKAAGCPNKNWTATITDVSFSNPILIVEQNGKVVLRTNIDL